MQCDISFRNTVIRHLYTLWGGHHDVWTLFGTILVIAILLTMTFQLLIGITEMNSLIDESACITTITMESPGNVVVESESLPSLWSLICLPLSLRLMVNMGDTKCAPRPFGRETSTLRLSRQFFPWVSYWTQCGLPSWLRACPAALLMFISISLLD